MVLEKFKRGLLVDVQTVQTKTAHEIAKDKQAESYEIMQRTPKSIHGRIPGGILEVIHGAMFGGAFEVNLNGNTGIFSEKPLVDFPSRLLE